MDFVRRIFGVGTAKAPAQNQNVSRSQIDSLIAKYKNMYGSRVAPEQYAQQLSNNLAGVSYQEILSRLQSGVNDAPINNTGFTAESQVHNPSSGGGGGYDPNYDPAAITSGRNAIRDLINQANSVYESLYGTVNRIAGEKRSNLERSYGQQFQDLTKGYEDTTTSMNQAYASRGLADSSFRNKGLAKATDTFNRERGNLRSNYDQNLASIGQYVSGTIDPLRAQQAQLGGINVDQYGDVSSLNSLQSQIQGILANLQQQNSGIGTQSDFIKHTR